MQAKVVLRESIRSFDREYIYGIPSSLQGSVTVGSRVLVPFGPGERPREAYVTSVGEMEADGFSVKEILAAPDRGPVLRPDQIRLADSMRRIWACTYGDALRTMVPSGISLTTKIRIVATEPGRHRLADTPDNPSLSALLRTVADRPEGVPEEDIPGTASIRKALMEALAGGLVRREFQVRQGVREKTRTVACLVDPDEAAALMDDRQVRHIQQVRVLEALLEYGPMPMEDLLALSGVTKSTLATLRKKGLVELLKEENPARDEDAALSPDAEPPVLEPDATPTADQDQAIRRLADAMEALSCRRGDPREFLLHGVTGSGKTEVYLQVAGKVLRSGRGAIILVPEISLTPQMVRRIQDRFGSDVAVLHSRLTPLERTVQWRRVLEGGVRLVVGARSAVFAPLADIGLLVVDEEQETSYKSESTPRYHAVDVARLRCQDHCALLVLGSATPSVESFARTRDGRSERLVLPVRIGSAGLPAMRIVDMRRELAEGNRSIFSRDLAARMTEALAAGEQAMLFLNRRGHSGSVLCRECGHLVRCRSCSVGMTYHTAAPRPGEREPVAQGFLVCHYCGRILPVPTRCPACGGTRIGRFGAGTQQVEQLFRERFPDVPVLRMDQDTTSGRMGHERILDAFRSGQAKVLIGTQMIAKGHDFPQVTVVGILSADLMLAISDFRSSERAFQLMVQAAGRAGRGDAPGTVVIQTYNPDDFAIRCAAAHDYDSFFRNEERYRRTMEYPPFGSVGIVTASSANPTLASEAAKRAAAHLRSRIEDRNLRDVSVMDPSRAPLYRLHDRYRWRVVIKAAQRATVSALLGLLADQEPDPDVSLSLDVDPYQML